jgi:multidrug efflux pump subunit AcrA (membrane-fusion protein)
VGQKAILTFDALTDVTLTGKVTFVDDTGTNSSGVVSYTATITPDTTNDSILGGMSVSANIITETHTDVVAVPNAAIKTSTSGSYVLLYKGASVTPVQQTVTVGLSDDSYTEIKSGLSVDTKVVIQTINPNATATTVRSGSGSNSILGGSSTGSRTGAGAGQLPPTGF